MTPQQRAEHLVENMSIEELLSQLRYNAPSIPRLGIPEYNWWNEGLHGAARSGTATVFPQAIGLAALFDPVFLYEIASIISTEQRVKYNLYTKEDDRGIYKGLTVWSPNINIFRDPRWGRGQETYGEDPYLTSILAVAFIKGLQGEGPHLKTASCVKHFAVHSGPEPLRHHFNAIVSDKDLEETYLPAFEAAVIEGRVNAVMGAYSAVNGEACCASPFLIKETLRGKWGFTGMFISDCWAIRDFHQGHHVTTSVEESAALALNAGCDLACGNEYEALATAFEKGLVTVGTIKQAATRVMTTRYALGMPGDSTEYDHLGLEHLDSDDHARVALEASRRCLVLLKNDAFLPLARNKFKTIAVIGPNADNRTALWGNYHGTSSRYTTILEGLRSYTKGFATIRYSEGSGLTKRNVERLAQADDRVSEAVFMAKNSDLVLLCLGLDERVEGEMRDDGSGGWAGDKSDLRLPEAQRILLNAVAQVGKPTIVILLSGGAIDPEIEAYPNIRALIQGWYPGQQGGQALAELLFGEYSPSGKLPVTFYKASAQLPDFEDYSMAKRTYRYCDYDDVLYPFGFGLSYGSFSYSLLTVQEGENDSVIVKGLVTNTSAIPARTIAQLYLKVSSSDAPPHPVLVGVNSIHLLPHEEHVILFTVDKKHFTMVNEHGTRYPVYGRYTLFFGSSQPDKKSKELGAEPYDRLDRIR